MASVISFQDQFFYVSSQRFHSLIEFGLEVGENTATTDEERSFVSDLRKRSDAFYPQVTVIEVTVLLVVIYILAVRLTVLASLVALVLFYLFYPVHRSRRALTAAVCVLALAVLIPFDVYVRGFHGPLDGSRNSGPRLVRVVWGMPMIQRCLEKYGEFVSGGCVVRIHNTKSVLVWD